MNYYPKPAQANLEAAFTTFSQVSESLMASYRDLEQRASLLTHELGQARFEQQRQLQEKERLANRLALLLDALPGGVVVLGADGLVQECNPAARDLLGEPLQGEPWRTVVERAFAPRPDDGHDISLCSGRRVNIATCSLNPEPGQVLLLKDVSETRALQEQLSQFRRLSAMGEMAASLAHQVRTPLASALLYSGALARARMDAPARLRYTAKLRGVLTHLEGLVHDMLAFARTGSFELETLTAADLFAALQDALETLAAQQGGACVLHNRAAGTGLRGNREALVSAFGNLYSNAVQAGGAGVRVEVELARAASGGLRLSLSDDGPGVPPDLAERLFEPFVSGRSAGTGLGLAVVRAVMQSHGGDIHLDREHRPGARFVAGFPPLDVPPLPGPERTGKQDRGMRA